MKIREAEILIIPGFDNSGPEHWQTRWQEKLPTARRVEQASWDRPVRDDWVARIRAEVERAEKPVVLVAHSLGVLAVAHAAAGLPAGKVRGAFLVAPPAPGHPDYPPAIDPAFAGLPREPLPFPSMLVASRTDPLCDFAVADDYAGAWGSLLVDAGDAGHINTASGYGPWPDGLLRLGVLMKRL